VTAPQSNGNGGASRTPGMLRSLPTRLMQWGMNAVYSALIVALPLYALTRVLTDQKTRSRWGAYLKDMPTRFGKRVPRHGTRPCIWVHGVSVGEVKAAARLIEVIEQSVPGVEVIISVTTDTGNRVARKRYPHHRVEFYPPDLSWIVADVLDKLRPDLMILVESEFWPNFLVAAHARGLPVALVNGRMSPRSANRFRMFGLIARPLLQTLERVCVQLPVYAERFASLGVVADCVHVTGNMKFDNIPIKQEGERRERFARLMGAGDGVPVIVAGSTHPGEERAMASIAKRFAGRGIAARFIIAPRHPPRADSVETEIRRVGLDVARRSGLDGTVPPPRGAVVLLDTVGELELAYGLADAVFVGGTLVRHGGQNMMEPASLGRAVVVGPYIENFRGEVDMLLDADGLVLAHDEAGVEETLQRWITDPDSAAACGRRAQKVIDDSKGATDMTLEVLRPLLERVRNTTQA